jgi:hypothetical protein
MLLLLDSLSHSVDDVRLKRRIVIGRMLDAVSYNLRPGRVNHDYDFGRNGARAQL